MFKTTFFSLKYLNLNFLYLFSPIHAHYSTHSIFVIFMPLSMLDKSNFTASEVFMFDSYVITVPSKYYHHWWEYNILHFQWVIRTPPVGLLLSCLWCRVQFSVLRCEECTSALFCQNCILGTLQSVTKHCKHSLIILYNSLQSCVSISGTTCQIWSPCCLRVVYCTI